MNIRSLHGTINSKLKDFYFFGYFKMFHSLNFWKKTGFDKNTYDIEYHKYYNLSKKEHYIDNIRVQMHSAMHTKIHLFSDNLNISDNPLDPIVLVVVKNDLARMKMFMDYYRELKISQFIVIDNNSNDGTREWLKDQEGVRLYLVDDSFQTHKKEGWIEKILAMTGYDRWYIVVDSDELLDYIGREEHSIQDFIKTLHDRGYDRANGYMLDMYSENDIFCETCDPKDIPLRHPYFDQEGYSMDKNMNMIIGGPRSRLMNTNICLSKQSVFFFRKDTLYRTCHTIYPYKNFTKVGCYFILRHYKFLPHDLAEYKERILKKNFFNNSYEYKMYFDQNQNVKKISLFHEGSKQYTSSYSLKSLPYLEEIPWH